MKLRPLLVSIAVLAPLSLAAWWLGRPADSGATLDTRVGQRIVEPDALASATRLELKSDGKTLNFTRAESGRWVIEGTPALPADLDRLARLSSDLVTPKIDRFVSARPEKLATYELDKTSVTYRDVAGKELFALHLGKSPEGGGRILRIGDEQRAYLARLALSLDTDAARWRNTALFSGLSASDIASVRIGFSTTDKAITITREKPDQPWTSSATPQGQRVKASVLSTQTGNLSGLRYTAVAPNLDPGVVAARVFPREIGFTTFSGRSVSIEFNRTPEPPTPPAPTPKEGETPPPPPAAAPRPVYVSITDSLPDSILAEAAKTHAFEVADWIYSALPASPADLFETDPAANTSGETSPSTNAESISVTTPPITAPVTATAGE